MFIGIEFSLKIRKHCNNETSNKENIEEERPMKNGENMILGNQTKEKEHLKESK